MQANMSVFVYDGRTALLQRALSIIGAFRASATVKFSERFGEPEKAIALW